MSQGTKNFLYAIGAVLLAIGPQAQEVSSWSELLAVGTFFRMAVAAAGVFVAGKYIRPE